jgi:hypothetical protein
MKKSNLRENHKKKERNAKMDIFLRLFRQYKSLYFFAQGNS